MSRIEKFQNHFQKFTVEDLYNRGAILHCKKCSDEHQYTNPSLNRFVRNNEEPVCRSEKCKPVIPKGFISTAPGIIKCKKCHLEYIHHKKTKYFVCYCQLNTKQNEHSLYRKLFTDDEDFTLYREVYFDKENSTHKTDIVAIYQGRKLWIEVDDLNHFYQSADRYQKDQDFIKHFKEHRSENQYHIRVLDVT
jgi:hypothetical protein